MAKNVINIEIKENKAVYDLIDQLPMLLQNKTMRKASIAAGRIGAKRAKQKAPRSEQTGTRKLWSATTKAKRGATQMADHIKAYPNKRWEEPGDAQAKVWAPLAYLLEFGHVMVAWGHRTSKRVAPSPFFRAALDGAVGEMKAKMVKVAKADLHEETESLKRKSVERKVK